MMRKYLFPSRRILWPPLRSLALAIAVASPLTAAWAIDAKASQYYEDALQRFEKKDYAGSIIQLKNALKIDNKQLAVQMLLGKALLANSDVAAAEVAFNEALKLGVNRAEVIVPLAQSLIGQARLQEVISDAKFAPAGLPPGIQAQLLLIHAAALSDSAGAREALQRINEARALDPQSVDSWLAEIPIRIRARQFKEARAAADRAIAMVPTSAEARYLRGSIAHVQGDIQGALADYDKALELGPTHTEARIARAGLRVDQGKLDEALSDIQEVRRLSPLDPRAPYLGSLVSERRGDPKAAKAALSDVTGILDPVPMQFMRYKPQLLTLGGLAHFGLGANEKARPYLEAVVRDHPESPAAKLLGQIYVRSGDLDRAIETLEAYRRSQAGDQQAAVLLATAQLGKGRSARAADLLKEALRLQDTPHLRTFLGMALAGGGKRADALVELENAFRRDPKQVAAGAALVDLYISSRQPARAVEVAEALNKRVPNDAQILTVLGTALAQAGNTARARAAYAQALKLNPRFVPAQVYLARLEVQTGQLDAAAKRLEAVLATNDKHVEALTELGHVAERRGLTEQAARLYEKAADHSAPSALKPALILVDHYLRYGQVDLATTAVARLNGKAPEAVSVLLANARVRQAAKDLPGAQVFLTRASRAAGFDAPQQAQIAVQQLLMQDAKGAAYSAQKALQAQPDYLPAKAVMVDIQLRLGDLQSAEQGVRDILARQPNLAVGHSLKGDVAMARGQPALAIDAYKRAHQIDPTSRTLRNLYAATARSDPAAAAQLADRWIKANPKDIEVRRMLADGHARAGNFTAARDAYETLVAQSPNDAEALNNLANALLQLKDPGALKAAERALAIKPQAAYIVSTVGWAAFQAGQSDRALQLLRDARLRDPADADTRYFLGAVLASKGRAGEAQEELRAALQAGRALNYAHEAQSLLSTLR